MVQWLARSARGWEVPGSNLAATFFEADYGGQALVRVRHDHQVLFVELVVGVADDVQQDGQVK